MDAEQHRTRVNNCFLIERWDPEATLRQKAQERLQTLHPRRGETIYLIIDDSKTAKRGKAMDAITKVNDPVPATDIQGHQSVCAILVCRDQVIPWGIRLYVKPQHAKALGRPFRKTTELAAQLIREFKAPRGVKVMALLDAYDRCHPVVQACREKHVRCAATLKGHRSLFKPGWKLKAGRYGRNLFRRRHTTSLVLTKPHGPIRYRPLEAGWLQVSSLGGLRVVVSRQGAARKILGLVTDDSELAAAELIQTDETRWAVEQFFKDCQQLLGLGQDPNRSYGAAVTHLPLVCFASALLTHLRLEPAGAQGQRQYHQAAQLSTVAAQDQLRTLLWDDLVAYLKEQCHEKSVLTELERLRVA